MTFNQKSNLKRHESTHILANHCDLCGARNIIKQFHSLACPANLKSQTDDTAPLSSQTTDNYLCIHCWNSFSIESDFINHKTTCHGNTSSLHNQDTASTSQINFDDCGETIKQEIKEEVEDDFDPSDFMATEFCEDIVEEDCEISLEPEVKAESIDGKETIKLEIQETKDLKDPLSIDIEDESFAVKMEDKF